MAKQSLYEIFSSAKLRIWLLASVLLSPSFALAEVCDKIDENWNVGDAPIRYIGSSLLALTSPFFLFTSAITLVVGYFVFARHIYVKAAVFLSIFWGMAALFLYYADDINEPVTVSAIKEGCIGGGASLIHPSIVCILIAGALLFLCTLDISIPKQSASHEKP
jgi:hypothetical protein